MLLARSMLPSILRNMCALYSTLRFDVENHGFPGPSQIQLYLRHHVNIKSESASTDSGGASHLWQSAVRSRTLILRRRSWRVTEPAAGLRPMGTGTSPTDCWEQRRTAAKCVRSSPVPKRANPTSYFVLPLPKEQLGGAPGMNMFPWSCASCSKRCVGNYHALCMSKAPTHSKTHMQTCTDHFKHMQNAPENANLASPVSASH